MAFRRHRFLRDRGWGTQAGERLTKEIGL